MLPLGEGTGGAPPIPDGEDDADARFMGYTAEIGDSDLCRGNRGGDETHDSGKECVSGEGGKLGLCRGEFGRSRATSKMEGVLVTSRSDPLMQPPPENVEELDPPRTLPHFGGSSRSFDFGTLLRWATGLVSPWRNTPTKVAAPRWGETLGKEVQGQGMEKITVGEIPCFVVAVGKQMAPQAKARKSK